MYEFGLLHVNMSEDDIKQTSLSMGVPQCSILPETAWKPKQIVRNYLLLQSSVSKL